MHFCNLLECLLFHNHPVVVVPGNDWCAAMPLFHQTMLHCRRAKCSGFHLSIQMGKIRMSKGGNWWIFCKMPYLMINDLCSEFEYSRIVCHSVECQPVERDGLRECHAKTGKGHDRNKIIRMLMLQWDSWLTLLDSGRHECCWPGTRTNFSISWFKPSTELRIGRWDEHGRTGIVSGLAVLKKTYENRIRPSSRDSNEFWNLLWLGLSVCELTECSPPRCTLCSLCLTIFSIFPSLE